MPVDSLPSRPTSAAYSSKSKPGGKILQKIALIAGSALMIAFLAPTAWAAAQETETGIQKAKEQYTAAFNKGDPARLTSSARSRGRLAIIASKPKTAPRWKENGWAFGSRNLALGNSTPMSGTRISRLF
jgi:hypothetical protein